MILIVGMLHQGESSLYHIWNHGDASNVIIAAIKPSTATIAETVIPATADLDSAFESALLLSATAAVEPAEVVELAVDADMEFPEVGGTSVGVVLSELLVTVTDMELEMTPRLNSTSWIGSTRHPQGSIRPYRRLYTTQACLANILCKRRKSKRDGKKWDDGNLRHCSIETEDDEDGSNIWKVVVSLAVLEHFLKHTDNVNDLPLDASNNKFRYYPNAPSLSCADSLSSRFASVVTAHLAQGHSIAYYGPDNVFVGDSSWPYPSDAGITYLCVSGSINNAYQSVCSLPDGDNSIAGEFEPSCTVGAPMKHVDDGCYNPNLRSVNASSTPRSVSGTMSSSTTTEPKKILPAAMACMLAHAITLAVFLF